MSQIGKRSFVAVQCTNRNEACTSEFDFNFAKPPVAPAPLELRFAVQVKPGAAGQRPMSDILVQSVFSLPVERGWPRDKLSPAEVAESMSGVLADRLPRFAADYWGSSTNRCASAATRRNRPLAGSWRSKAS